MAAHPASSRAPPDPDAPSWRPVRCTRRVAFRDRRAPPRLGSAQGAMLQHGLLAVLRHPKVPSAGRRWRPLGRARRSTSSHRRPRCRVRTGPRHGCGMSTQHSGARSLRHTRTRTLAAALPLASHLLPTCFPLASHSNSGSPFNYRLRSSARPSKAKPRHPGHATSCPPQRSLLPLSSPPGVPDRTATIDLRTRANGLEW